VRAAQDAADDEVPPADDAVVADDEVAPAASATLDPTIPA